MTKRLLTSAIFATLLATGSSPSAFAASAPVAGGAIQERVYVNWGELEVARTDLDAGGRAGWNVVISRVYRSRTLGGTEFGMGWDSPILRRLRALPDGQVEYHDGLGDIWTFSVDATTRTYISPPGLGQRLTRSESGWTLIDTKWRITKFDDLGRLTLEGDEFYQPYRNAGNRIAYLYGPDGNLSTILDPLDRATTIAYWTEADYGVAGAFPGNIRAITDWRNRTVRYEYDPATANLVRVILPRMNAAVSEEAVNRYTYSTAGTTYNDAVELHSNLVAITDPGASLPRLEVEYETSGVNHDKIVLQKWATGERVRLEYPSETTVKITDALGQVREYTIANVPAVPRPQILTLVERGVAVSRTPFGALPDLARATAASQTTPQDRTSRFTYWPSGELKEASLEGVRTTKVDWKKPPQLAGFIPTAITTSPTAPVAQRLAKTAPFAAEPITIGFVWQGDPGTSTPQSLGAYLQSVTANGRRREVGEPHRDLLEPVTNNDSITAKTGHDSTGQLRSVRSSGGTDPGSAGADVVVDWYGADAPIHARGLPKSIRSGDTLTRIEYPTANRTVTTDARGITTSIDTNDWGLPVRRQLSGPGLTTDESWFYDGVGRVVESRRKQGPLTVITTTGYDLMGRVTRATVDNVNVDGSLQSVTTRVAWDIPNRQVVTTLPSGATLTRTFDTLGRTEREAVWAGPTGTIETRFEYDLDGNLVHATDGFTASATAWDVHGRPVARLYSDGTRTRHEWDPWGNPFSVAREDAAGSTISKTGWGYTEAGRLNEVIDILGDDPVARKTSLVWDAAGRTTGSGIAPLLTGSALKAAPWNLDPAAARGFKVVYDSSGRLTGSSLGQGTALALDDVLERRQRDSFAGFLPQRVTASDRAGTLASATLQYDTLGNAALVSTGNLSWQSRFDERSNLTALEPPGLGGSQWSHDALGRVTSAMEPENGSHAWGWNAAGALARYTDPASEATRTESDLLGRPLSRVYPDGSVERFSYEGWRVKSVTDRQGRIQNFEFNTKGQLVAILAPGGGRYDELDYDSAGRLTLWRNKDSELRWESFDAEGRPRRTVTRRYARGSGFTTKELLDEYVQQHAWNIHGERALWSMPWYEGLTPAGAWTREVRESHDAAGNVTTIERTLTSGASETLLSADYRGAGRPAVRAVTTHCSGTPCTPAVIERTYGYEAGTGRLERMEVSSRGLLVAGSRVAELDGLQIARLDLPGFGASRSARFGYDDRGRLRTAEMDARSSAAETRETLTPADFREATARRPVLNPSQRATLEARGIRVPALTGRSASFGELPGHRIGTIAEDGTVRAVQYDGALRRDDDRFLYEFDEKERLVRLTEKPQNPGPLTLRRVLYAYDGNDRLVGRRAEYALLAVVGVTLDESAWKLEDRRDILASDSLPAEVTYVWDPMADRLVSLFAAGASTSGTGDGLLRQMIHGTEGYDDPLEVAIANGNASSVSAVIPSEARTLQTTASSAQTSFLGPARLYPILDEAGTGSLQVVLNETGEVVARWGAAGAYGEDEYCVAGPAVEEITHRAKRRDDGTLEWVEVSIGITEALAEATIVRGARLAVTDAEGIVIREAAAAASSADAPGRLVWRLTENDWRSLIATGSDGVVPAILSIAVTSDLRAAAWGDTQVAPAPEWASALFPVRSSGELPVEYRASLAALASWLASIPAGSEGLEPLYAIDTLGGFGTARDGSIAPGDGYDDPIRLLVLAPFHAHPIQEPLGGFANVRNRWFDPGTGTWLTPDPLGYQDSSNLYAFCGGDPVNGRDPLGLGVLNDAVDWLGSTAPVQTLGSVGRAIDDKAAEAKRWAELQWKYWFGSKAPINPDAAQLELDAGGSVGISLGMPNAGSRIQDRFVHDTGEIAGRGVEMATREGTYVIAGGVIGKSVRVVGETVEGIAAERRLLSGGRVGGVSAEELRAGTIRGGFPENSITGRVREVECLAECQARGDRFLEQRTVFGADGKRALASGGKGRRFDVVRVENGQVTEVIEVTSPGEATRARKIRQLNRGDELLARDGTYVIDDDGTMIPFAPGVQTTLITKP